MKHPALGDEVTREALISRYRAFRDRTRLLFEIPSAESYYSRPIPLRNPIVFYEGHLPAFMVNTLVKLALGGPGIDEAFEVLFARGIDPDSVTDVHDPSAGWPSRSEVIAYGAEADRRIIDILRNAPLEREEVPQLRGGEAAFTILEHELMHQETLLYMFHNLPYDQKRPVVEDRSPRLSVDDVEDRSPRLSVESSSTAEMVRIEGGAATLGACRSEIGFGWDNEFPAMKLAVDAFEISRYPVTNGEYLEFMEATGAAAPHFWVEEEGAWFWRGMFEQIPLPDDWPVYVTLGEAEAFAQWKGMRIPSEAEYHRAAFGTPDGSERSYPWGDQLPDSSHGVFNFERWDPGPVGARPRGASAWGVDDLVGNGWEWTSTIFAGFPGFRPMASYPQYSIDFFDGQHFVLKGASPATAGELIRRSFRNWFRPDYPYLYAKFRLAR
ncbi:MAG TPA: SUMF1/EgtB/PvdO family nonheme iron enzyme [Thermoanaerobaculia bacterium]|nr:SUMF1/EgtB/PvdO family nonheme iron enzyme [Thermoanaerobaculia bacterium]